MLVGQTGSGKSVCWRILQAAMTRLKRDGDPNFNIVRVRTTTDCVYALYLQNFSKKKKESKK